MFLLWLLTELFRILPEAGDLDKPKLVFFFDEAHLLFADAPEALIQQVERLVRLVRSKGGRRLFRDAIAGGYPGYRPGSARLQNAVRPSFLYPKGSAHGSRGGAAFRESNDLDVKAEITKLAVGEALFSVLNEHGIPTPVAKVDILPPRGQVDPVTDMERDAVMASSDLRAKYSYGLEEGTAYSDFVDRMRAQRGLVAIEHSETSGPLDIREFVPGFIPQESVPSVRRKALQEFAVWSGVLVANVATLAWLVS